MIEYRRFKMWGLTLFFVFFAAIAWGQAAAHLGHVQKSWNDTPGKVGLVTILAQEAQIAATHAGKANPCDAGSMRSHVPHVRHAVDPGSEGSGPGKGYGLTKAAKGVAAHMDFARKAGDASDSLKMHSVHVISAANNIAQWGDEIMALSMAARSGDGKALKRLQALTQAILKGQDANGDGKISWKAGEGGLAQLNQHLGFIKQ